jgi:hypothetical protein
MAPSPKIEISAPIERGRSWIGFVIKASALLAVALIFTETFWRSLGYLPAGSDIRRFARLRKVADGDHEAVALLGSSRVRYGLNPEVLARAVPGWHFHQLGILGNAAMPVLEDLANDLSFQGRVICELNPAQWGGGYPFTRLPEALAYTHTEATGAYLETILSEWFREHVSFFSYNLLTEAPRILQHKPVPEPERLDRFVRFHDLGPAVNESLINNWERGTFESADRIKRNGYARITQEAMRWVDQIRHRGGGVAFVRMPVDGRLRVVEESAFPHTQGLIRDVRARGVVVIDFAEMPAHFRCPDGSHLEASEADRFSQLLAKDLAAKGFFH